VKQSLLSLFIALAILLGILFLPEATYKPIADTLDLFTRATSTAYELGSHLVSNLVSALITGLVLFLLISSIKRERKERGEEEDIN